MSKYGKKSKELTKKIIRFENLESSYKELYNEDEKMMK